MFTSLFHGPLAVDEGAAVAAAIALAHTDFNPIAKSIHIHVLNVVEIEGKWQAIIQVIVEPVLEEHEEKKKSKDREPEPKAKEWEKEEFQEIEEYKPAEIHPMHLPEYHRPDQILTDVMEDANMHIYMRGDDASAYYDPSQYSAHPDYHFHFVDKGSMWEATRTIYPDIALYESAHPPALDTRIVHEEPSMEYLRKRQRELQQERSLLELTEDF